jgi:hypothetical protein
MLRRSLYVVVTEVGWLRRWVPWRVRWFIKQLWRTFVA